MEEGKVRGLKKPSAVFKREEVVGKMISVDTSKQLRVNRKEFQVLLEECQTKIELLMNTIQLHGDDDNDDNQDDGENEGDADKIQASSTDGCCIDSETSQQLHDLLKSTVESPNFLEKLGSVYESAPQISTEEGSSWDMINKNDVWEGGTIDGDFESGQEGYVLVNQEDIVEGIACFMATYLMSIQQSKELSPNQLQEALSKTFSVKKKKGKLQKAWDGSKVLYNVASWGATAVGIYQNPALFKAASLAFWSSCRVILKLF